MIRSPIVRWLGAFLALGLMTYMCALPGELPADSDVGTGLAGTYSVNGVDPSGAEFGGTAVLTNTDDANHYTYDLIITGSIQTGDAVHNADLLEITWRAVESGIGEVTGTGVFDIGDDGAMTGTWSADGDERVGTIELFPDP